MAFNLKKSAIQLLSTAVGLWLFLTPSQGQAMSEPQNLAQEVSLFLDSNNAYTLSDLLKRPELFQENTSSSINLGSYRKRLWVKVSVEVPDDGNKYGLQINRTMLDSIHVYYWHQGILQVKRGGLTFFDERTWETNDYFFALPETGRNTVYFCIQSNSFLQVPLYFGNVTSFVAKKHKTDLFYGSIVGVFLIMFVYNLFIFIYTRDKPYLIYILHVFTMLVIILFSKGFLYELFSDHIPFIQQTYYTPYCVAMILANLFAMHFLKSQKITPKLHSISTFFVGYHSFILLLYWCTDLPTVFFFSFPAVLLNSTLLIVMGVMSYRSGYKPARLYIWGWSILLITSTLINLLKLQGILPFNFFTNHCVELGAMIEVVLFSLALADKINFYKQENEHAQKAAILLLEENKAIILDQNQTLEKKVKERTLQLEKQNATIQKQNEEKAALLREVHHRVKNNLQIVNSLLRFQSREVVDERDAQLFEEAQNRILAIALLHERLYQGDSFKYVDIQEHFEFLIKHLVDSMRTHEQIEYEVHVDSINLSMKTLVPLGLILNEVITNSMKYAFQDRKAGKLKLSLNKQPENQFLLIVEDDGVGFSPEQETPSIGTELIELFVEQLNGTLKLSTNDSGTRYEITFESID